MPPTFALTPVTPPEPPALTAPAPPGRACPSVSPDLDPLSTPARTRLSTRANAITGSSRRAEVRNPGSLPPEAGFLQLTELCPACSPYESLCRPGSGIPEPPGYARKVASTQAGHGQRGRRTWPAGNRNMASRDVC